ncbi:spore germination protein [Ornithinibacillus salinisoli]|uniref:Spore germination protein n=1 Tax=Ornithinibacillus salinisoli TaxID=1848459 RepID=A0ABW4VXM7_9BACI
MKSIFLYFKDSLTYNDDLFMTEHIYDDVHVVLFGLKSLIDLPKTNQAIQNQIQAPNESKESVVQHLQDIGDKITTKEQALSAIFNGKLLIYITGNPSYFISVIPINKELQRSIEAPTNESVLQGSQYSFNEDRNINVGLLRKEIVSEKLKVKDVTIGQDNTRNISVLYYESKADQQMIDKVIQLLEKNKSKELHHIQDLTKMLGLSGWNVVSQLYTTELPQEASTAIFKGKIVLFVDRFPFALILPSMIGDMFMLENDRNFTYPLMISIRSLRIFGFLMTLILPSLYVALVSVNPEVLRIELALSVAQSREGVPYPAFVEIIIMLLILELILEASVRLPKSVGPTITMVGGIILGQAVVEAKLVSNLLIIILAAVTIANSTIVGVQNSTSIRLFKYIILIFSASFGVLGILVGLFFVCAYLSSINTFGVPYLNVKFSKDDLNNG